MAKRIQLRRGTTAQINAFTGAVGEVSVDTDKKVLVVHDGVTAGGFPVAARANVDGTVSLLKKDGTGVGTINSEGLFNDTLTSTNTNQALTAAQGKALKDSLNATVASSFGNNQTMQDVTASRAVDTTYTNMAGKAIVVMVTSSIGTTVGVVGYVGGVIVISSLNSASSGVTASITFVVPASTAYKVTGSFSKWVEYR